MSNDKTAIHKKPQTNQTLGKLNEIQPEKIADPQSTRGYAKQCKH